MAWVLVDDSFMGNDKWTHAPGDSIATWVAALAWCNREESWDGRIPTRTLLALVNVKNPKVTVKDLEQRRAVHRDGDEHVIHDFAEWQKVDRKKAISDARRAAGKKGANNRWHPDGNSHESDGKPDGNCHGKPDGLPPTTNILVPISDNSTPENTPTAVDKSMIERVSDEYARLALGQAKLQGRAITDEDAYKRGARNKAKARPELDAWLATYPTAPPSAVAAWLMGDKHSMSYYVEPEDEMADVIQLREGA